MYARRFEVQIFCLHFLSTGILAVYNHSMLCGMLGSTLGLVLLVSTLPAEGPFLAHLVKWVSQLLLLAVSVLFWECKLRHCLDICVHCGGGGERGEALVNWFWAQLFKLSVVPLLCI